MRSFLRSELVHPLFALAPVVFLLLGFGHAVSQEVEAVPYSAKTSSQNHRYTLRITGKWCDDVPCGALRLTLQGPRHRLFWTKVIRGVTAMPIVSNAGDVAIATGSHLTFYGKSGKRKGRYRSDAGFQGDLFEMFQAYSWNGRRFYIITGMTPDSSSIVALSDSGREIHREPLSAEHPCLKNAIQTYRTRVIIADCGADDDPEYERACCVFDEDGRLIWEYDQGRRDHLPIDNWRVAFDARRGILNIVDGERRKSVKVDTLSP